MPDLSGATDPATMGRAMKNSAAPLWELTNRIAEAIYHADSPRRDWPWDRTREHDQWLAVGYWRRATAVVQALPLTIKVEALR